MNIVTPAPETCPACKNEMVIGRMKLRTCGGHCVRISNGLSNIRSMSDELVPHVHVTCGICSFEWLIEPADPEGVKKLW